MKCEAGDRRVRQKVGKARLVEIYRQQAVVADAQCDKLRVCCDLEQVSGRQEPILGLTWVADFRF